MSGEIPRTKPIHVPGYWAIVDSGQECADEYYVRRVCKGTQVGDTLPSLGKRVLYMTGENPTETEVDNLNKTIPLLNVGHIKPDEIADILG